MENKTIMKFIGKCQVIKTLKEGKDLKVTMKCPGNKKIKVTMAQDLIDALSRK